MEKLSSTPATRTALINGGIVLTKGQNVVKGGDNGQTIHMDVADIVVPPKGMVVLQTADAHRIGVINLTPPELGAATITMKGYGTYEIPASTQIVVQLPNQTAYRGDTRYPAGSTTQPGANNSVATRLDSTGPGGAQSGYGANNNLATRLDSRGPAGAQSGYGANSNLATRLDSRGPAGAQSGYGVNNNLATRLDSTGPASQQAGVASNNDLATRLDSRGPASQRLPLMAKGNVVDKTTNSSIVIQRFPFGDFKDLTPTYAATNVSAEPPAGPRSPKYSPATQESTGDLPRLMKAMVKMPEEVPKDLIWASTYHSFRYWLPIKPQGAVGGAIGEEQLSVRPNFTPIAYTTTTTVTAANNMHLTQGTSLVKENGTSYVLDDGAAIFGEEKAPRVVYTPHGSVTIDKGALVMISVTPQVTTVRNLYDNTTHGVAVKMENRSIEIKPGQEAALVHGPRSRVFDTVFMDNVARRDMAITSVTDNKHIAVSDFSHVNLMMSNPMLRSLKASQDAQGQAQYKKLLKMAAVITSVHDRTRAPYAVPFAPISNERVATNTNPEM